MNVATRCALRNTVTHLPRGRLQPLRGPVRLCVERGTVWITVDGSPEDVILEAGEARSFASGARLLAWALGGDAAYVVQCEGREKAAPWPAESWRALLRRLAQHGPAPRAGGVHP